MSSRVKEPSSPLGMIDTLDLRRILDRRLRNDPDLNGFGLVLHDQASNDFSFNRGEQVRLGFFVNLD